MTNATHLAVIYATNSKVLRRKVIPDNDAQLHNLIVQRGESLLLIPLDQPYDDAACRAAVAGATGIVPPSGRCCVIDGSGMVIAVCNADPALDTHPEGTLVANETASRGDRYMNGEFVRPAGATAVLSVSVSATSRGSLAHSDGN